MSTTQPWRDEDGRVDLAAARRAVYDGPMAGESDADYSERIDEVAGDLIDEVERLRAPGPCPRRDGIGRCSPSICTYGTIVASLSDYSAKLGDSAIEVYLARCPRCGAVFAGVTPGGVYRGEPGFDERVRWMPVLGALVGGEER